MDEWTTFRLDGAALHRLGAGVQGPPVDGG
jgi:hypothetical protein